MVVNDLRCPGQELVLVVLLPAGFDLGKYFEVGHQVGAYLVEELSHFLVATEKVRALALENANAKSKGNLTFSTSKQPASGNGKQHYCKFFCNSATVQFYV